MRILLLSLIAVAAVQAETVALTDFTAQWTRVTNNQRGSGELPGRWVDNSNWAALTIRHERLVENDTPFLRTTVSDIENGWGQIQHDIPRVTSKLWYRVRIRTRSLDELPATIGIRRRGSPYNYLWQTTVRATPTWRDGTYHALIDAADYDVSVYIAFSGAGRFDLGAFQVERLTEAELISQIQSGAVAEPKNLFRNTRFPLGLPPGWVLDRDSSDGDVVQVDSSPEHALHVKGSKAWQITTEPVAVAKPRAAYTASFRAWGNATGRLAVLADGGVIATRSFRLTAEPQRLSVTFTAPLLGRAQALRIEASQAGEAWMDQFQLEAGSAVTEFTPPACELHFGSASDFRVDFDDAPLSITSRILGDSSCAQLQLRAEDLYGSTVELEGMQTRSPEGKVSFGLHWPPSAYGAYRVEGWVEDKEGNRVSPYQEITVFRLRRPRYWRIDAHDSPFGIHTNSTTRHILMAKAAGFNWTRLHDAGLQYIGWYHLERKPGEWTFYDADLARYREHGMKILGLLSTAPEWASHFDKARNGYYDRFYQPRDLNQFANYVRVVTSRYHGLIDTWDVWNEPWNAGWWAVSYNEAERKYVTSERPQADFARMVETAASAARSVDPSLTILGLNSSAGSNGMAWSKGVVEAGGLESPDVLCYHQYTTEANGFANDAMERGYRDALGPAGKTEKPVWMTEGSPMYGIIGPGFYRRLLPFDNNENFTDTGDRTVRYVVSLLAQNVKKVFLYSMHSHESFAGSLSSWRVIVGEDGYLHPTAAAHSAMAWVLEGTQFVRRIEPAPGVTAFLFETSGRSVAVLAPRAGVATTWTPSARLTRHDLWGNVIPGGAPLGRTVSYLLHNGDAASLESLLR